MHQPLTTRTEGERLLTVNGVSLSVGTFGDPGDPAILLLAGATADMGVWEAEFCTLLAGGRRFVVRYDHRDTGGSDSFELGSPPYGFDDLVADAAALLDGLGVRRAHLIGASMGGAIAQRLALDEPQRVASLTLIATSPGLRPSTALYPDLPPMSPELQAQFAAPPPTPAHNHWIIDGGSAYRSRLGRISVPTLVIHGAEDPLFPLGHGEALAREIPGARLTPLAGVGHQPPPRHTWDTIVPELLRHTAG